MPPLRRSWTLALALALLAACLPGGGRPALADPVILPQILDFAGQSRVQNP